MILNLKKITAFYLITVILAIVLLFKILQIESEELWLLPFSLGVNRLIFSLLTIVSVNYLVYYDEIFNISELTFSNSITYFKVFINKLIPLCMLSFIYMTATTLVINYFFEIGSKLIIFLPVMAILYTAVFYQIIVIFYHLGIKYYITIISSILILIIFPSTLQFLKFSTNSIIEILANYNLITLLYDSIFDVTVVTRYLGLIIYYLILIVISTQTLKLYIKKM